MKEKQSTGDSYSAQLIFASRAFDLHPNDAKDAVRLLDLIPKNDAQETVWLNLADGLCPGESFEEMKILGRLRDNLPRAFARAVLIAPDKMQDYVSYAIEAVQDPHNDYAVQMRTVCKERHEAFQEAVNKLSPRDRDWFPKHILDPAGCRVRALPEE